MKRWANNVTAILPERLLHAYVDVMLPPAKRRAVESALLRHPDLRKTVDGWLKQNADLRRLALLENPPPMPPEMSGVVHRLEGRLRRRAPLEFLRIAAAISLFLAGGTGAAIITQHQLTGSDPIAGFTQKADETHRAVATQPLETTRAVEAEPESASQAGVVTAPGIVPVGSPADDVEARREQGREIAPEIRQDETSEGQAGNRPNPDKPDPTVPAQPQNIPADPADPPRET